MDRKTKASCLIGCEKLARACAITLKARSAMQGSMFALAELFQRK